MAGQRASYDTLLEVAQMEERTSYFAVFVLLPGKLVRLIGSDHGSTAVLDLFPSLIVGRASYDTLLEVAQMEERTSYLGELL